MVQRSPSNEFVAFQKEFRKRQQQFGLTGYTVTFAHADLPGRHAEITINEHDRVATAKLHIRTAEQKKECPVLVVAKHEAIHLLLSRVQEITYTRYTSEAEIETAIEELVVKLETLIP